MLRRTLRIEVAVVLGALASVALVSSALAGDYHVGAQLHCSDCHIMHASKDGTIYGGGTATNPTGVLRMLKFASPNALCMSCHDGTDTTAPDVMASGTAAAPNDTLLDAYASPYKNSGGVFQSDYATVASNCGHNLGGGVVTATQGTWTSGATGMTCTDCHDPHTLRMQVDPITEKSQLCATCHSNVTSFSDYRAVTVDGIDYDGDGKAEGIFHEIEGAQEVLIKSMQTYAAKNLGKPLGFELGQFPYVFNDTNGDGTLSKDEAIFPNAFKSFTPRLQRAAFNYMFSVKDPAGYVHNGKYVLQLIFDAVADLRSVTGESGVTLIRPVAD